jgi:ribose/xylose/arabinose/galactoside ABC-type transport system permease subunit
MAECTLHAVLSFFLIIGVSLDLLFPLLLSLLPYFLLLSLFFDLLTDIRSEASYLMRWDFATPNSFL